MDDRLAGSLLLFVAVIPYVVEVLRQVPLQARFLAALPAPTRTALPPHPKNPWLTPAGSVRFFFALWRCARRDAPEDAPEIAVLKRKIRASIRRELAFACVAAGVLTALLAAGWRPLWP